MNIRMVQVGDVLTARSHEELFLRLLGHRVPQKSTSELNKTDLLWLAWLDGIQRQARSEPGKWSNRIEPDISGYDMNSIRSIKSIIEEYDSNGQAFSPEPPKQKRRVVFACEKDGEQRRYTFLGVFEYRYAEEERKGESVVTKRIYERLQDEEYPFYDNRQNNEEDEIEMEAPEEISAKFALESQLHEQYAVNNNEHTSAVLTLLASLITCLAAFGYVFIHTETCSETPKPQIDSRESTNSVQIAAGHTQKKAHAQGEILESEYVLPASEPLTVSEAKERTTSIAAENKARNEDRTEKFSIEQLLLTASSHIGFLLVLMWIVIAMGTSRRKDQFVVYAIRRNCYGKNFNVAKGVKPLIGEVFPRGYHPFNKGFSGFCIGIFNTTIHILIVIYLAVAGATFCKAIFHGWKWDVYHVVFCSASVLFIAIGLSVYWYHFLQYRKREKEYAAFREQTR